MSLTIGPTKIGGDELKDDYTVKEDGYGCGRIRLAMGLGSSTHWEWHNNPPVPIVGQRVGKAASRELAMADFKAAWALARPSLTDADVAHWRDLEDGVRERFGSQ